MLSTAGAESHQLSQTQKSEEKWNERACVRAASVGERQRETGRESAWLCLLGLRRSQTVRAPPPVEVEDSRPSSHPLPGVPASGALPERLRTHAAHFWSSAAHSRLPPSASPTGGRTLCGDLLETSHLFVRLERLPATRLGSARRGLEAAGAALGWAGADPGKSWGRTESFNPQQQQLRAFSVSVQFACHLQNKSPITSVPVCQESRSGEFGVSGGREKNSR